MKLLERNCVLMPLNSVQVTSKQLLFSTELVEKFILFVLFTFALRSILFFSYFFLKWGDRL